MSAPSNVTLPFTHPRSLRLIPEFHWFNMPWGAMLQSCNMYWSVGLECPWHKVKIGEREREQKK